MKTKTTYILIAIILFTVSSCSKTESNETYSSQLRFSEFNSIVIKNAGDVTISYGEIPKVIVEGNKESIQNIVSEVISNTLIIDIDGKDSVNEKIDYTIFIPEFFELTNEYSSEVTIEDFENEGYLNINNLGSGNISLGNFTNLSLLNVLIDGSGDVTSTSKFDKLTDLNIKIKGSGNYDCFSIASKNVIVNTDGSGDCSISVKEELNAFINGSGDIFYKGNPKIDSKIKGSGEIIKADF